MTERQPEQPQSLLSFFRQIGGEVVKAATDIGGIIVERNINAPRQPAQSSNPSFESKAEVVVSPEPIQPSEKMSPQAAEPFTVTLVNKTNIVEIVQGDDVVASMVYHNQQSAKESIELFGEFYLSTEQGTTIEEVAHVLEKEPSQVISKARSFMKKFPRQILRFDDTRQRIVFGDIGIAARPATDEEIQQYKKEQAEANKKHIEKTRSREDKEMDITSYDHALVRTE